MNKLVGIIASHLPLIRFFRTVVEALEAINVSGKLLADRIDMLEHAVYKGQRAQAIFVPAGMSPEVAWQHIRSGQTPIPKDGTAEKVYVLVDGCGNLLKVL